MTRFPRALAYIGLILPLAAVARDLPVPATGQVNFAGQIAPLLQKSCVQCHAKGKEKGGFSLETREAFLKGGESGAAVELGKSGSSLVVEMVAGLDADSVMPKKGSRWTDEQVGLLRAWIDQGMPWDAGFTFAKPEPRNLKPRTVPVDLSGPGNPIDALLSRYAADNGFSLANPVDDARFARRVYLDTVGVIPSPEQMERFVSDSVGDKRSRLVRDLLNDSPAYAAHWLSFWNDLLRNDYKGTGFIDGGRRQISGWLYNALVQNKPYDRFVQELVNPSAETEGFAAGILWRGNVNASMTPPMQAGQNVSQVFMGVNLKCAACHDSFINDWALADAYGMAAVYSDDPMELVHCDKPTGKQAALRFLYPELGSMDPKASKPERLKRFASLMTDPQNGRLSRTIVNRLWERLLGRGLVEPVDDMEQPAWSAEILDWLAEDLVQHRYDLKRTITMILTSRAYQLPAVQPSDAKVAYVFRGPLPRRLSAEQFSDSISSITGEWPGLPSSLEFDLTAGGALGSFAMPSWIWTNEPVSLASQRMAARRAEASANTAREKSSRARALTELGAPEAAQAVKEAIAATDEAAQVALAVESAAQGDERHRVIFRRRVNLTEAPTRAYASVLGTQSFDLLINGEVAKSVITDGARNGRVRLFDLRSKLRAGENVIVVSIDSHTEKSMNETERKEFPKSTKHLNARSGLAFYGRFKVAGQDQEILSDGRWRVRRGPDGDWGGMKLDESGWSLAEVPPSGVAPIDEGPGLEPLRRKDFANRPVVLAPALRPAASIAALTGRIRAAFLAADPLMTALDRPNREQVTTVRLSAPTTMQALELTNGGTLDRRLRSGAALLGAMKEAPEAWVNRMFVHALGRKPVERERSALLEMLGDSPSPERIADSLWAVLMLPEFQVLD